MSADATVGGWYLSNTHSESDNNTLLSTRPTGNNREKLMRRGEEKCDGWERETDLVRGRETDGWERRSRKSNKEREVKTRRGEEERGQGSPHFCRLVPLLLGYHLQMKGLKHLRRNIDTVSWSHKHTHTHTGAMIRYLFIFDRLSMSYLVEGHILRY